MALWKALPFVLRHLIPVDDRSRNHDLFASLNIGKEGTTLNGIGTHDFLRFLRLRHDSTTFAVASLFVIFQDLTCKQKLGRNENGITNIEIEIDLQNRWKYRKNNFYDFFHVLLCFTIFVFVSQLVTEMNRTVFYWAANILKSKL